MTTTELHWWSALNYVSPVIFNGIYRGTRIKEYMRDRPKQIARKKNISKEDMAKMNAMIEPMLKTHHYDSDICDAIKKTGLMIRSDGQRHSEWTIRLYIQRLRKKNGGFRPERPDTKADIVIKMINAGYSRDDTCKMAEVSINYYTTIKKRAEKDGLLNIIQKD